MSNTKGNGDDRRWTAEQINAQLDQIGEALADGVHDFIRGSLFGPGPRRRKPKPKPQRRQEPRDDE